jgi:hypothetical protein
VLDTYAGKPDPTGAFEHDLTMLETLAARVLDLDHQTLR